MGSSDSDKEMAAFAEQAIQVWAPAAKLVVRRVLTEGKSGALVQLVDVEPATASSDMPHGEFILKVDRAVHGEGIDRSQPTEHDRLTRVLRDAPEFAKSHLPELVRTHTHGEFIALLYTVAGSLSLQQVVTLGQLQNAQAIAAVSGRLAFALLDCLNRQLSVDQSGTLQQSLREWLGARLNAGSRLHGVSTRHNSGQPWLLLDEKLLVNPLWLCLCAELSRTPPVTRFVGHLHGDLHLDNVLCNRFSEDPDKYWVIDFGLAQYGPLFFDHAYLEFALLRVRDGMNPQRLRGLLEALDTMPSGIERDSVIPEDVGALRCLREIRRSVEGWRALHQANRAGPVSQQLQLARVAAGLNWANKRGLNEEQSRLAFLYAAWAATSYLREWQPGVWEAVVRQANTSATLIRAPAPSLSSVEKEAWTQVWGHLCQFDRSQARYILLTGRRESSEGLDSLGMLPWSLVLDFDPGSDCDGTYAAVAPVLEPRRSLRRFGQDLQETDFDRATAWMLAGGWRNGHEEAPRDLTESRRTRLPRIHELLQRLCRHTAQPIKALVLPGAGLEGDWLRALIDRIDEVFGGRADVIQLPTTSPAPPGLLSVDRFLVALREHYGSTIAAEDATLPSESGPVSLPLSNLRHLEEDLDILHSAVLRTSAPREHSWFWRGAAPTWADLQADADVLRDAHRKLVDDLKAKLDEHANHTVNLWHAPGAGGTTTALRAAWELREAYPVCVLRRFTRFTVDRLFQLQQLTKKSVLLVADGSVLSTPDREQLYRDLQTRNGRVVVLHVLRSTTIEPGRLHQLTDPMGDDEAQHFHEVYAAQTSDPQRKQFLRVITVDPRMRRYRTAFFYGLATYERDFVSVDRYVRERTRGISLRGRGFLEYVAMVSRFSQGGISTGAFRQILDISGERAVNLSEVLGDGPASLILDDGGRLRMLHPLIAEEFLEQSLSHDGVWKPKLKGLALNFVRDMVRVLRPDSEELHNLLFQLFISRGRWAPQAGASAATAESESDVPPVPSATDSHFSELIHTIPAPGDQVLVLTELTRQCPQEAHYFNHLGRHQMYVERTFGEAERTLLEAVRLADADPLHHHALGMVRRLWVEQIMAEALAGTTLPTATELLDRIDTLSDGAAKCFEAAKKRNPTDEHGYITHIQLINRILEGLLRCAKTDRIGDLIALGGSVAAWAEHNLGVAHELLDELERRRGGSRRSLLFARCERRLARFTGNHSVLIAKWEDELRTGTSGDPDLRRALSSTYRAKAGRLWGRMPETDLRRVAELMRDNLDTHGLVEHDLRCWFQAYKRLPEFSYTEAISRIENWAVREDALDAHYYLFILHFLRWYRGQEEFDDLVRGSIAAMRSRTDFEPQRNYAYEWLGSDDRPCPLLQPIELGGWDARLDFYALGAAKLRLVSGIVRRIEPPVQGWIRLGENLEAFFTPRGFYRNQDEGTEVHFYLGFTYDGLRAYNVCHGAGPRHPRDMPELVRERSAAKAKRMQTLSLLKEVRSYLMSLTRSYHAKRKVVPLGVVGSRLKEHFPGDEPVHQRLGYATLTALLRSIEELGVTTEGPEQGLRLASEEANH